MKSQKIQLEKKNTLSSSLQPINSKNSNAINQNIVSITSPKFNQIKISISSTIISQIYSQLCFSTSDIFGFLLGEYKQLKTTESKDSEINYQQNILHIIINNSIFIYDKNYLREKLEKIIDKINQKYTIVGLFSARYYSYTSISLKDQEVFMNALNYIKTKQDKIEKSNTTNTNTNLFKKSNSSQIVNSTPHLQNLPLLYGVFCHNVNEEDTETKLKTQNFYSKMFKFVEKNNNFETIPYEILNVKDTTYTNPINLLATKTVIESNKTDFEKPVQKLKNMMLDQMSHLEYSQQRELKDLKALLKRELNNNKQLYDMLKKYET